MSDIANIKDRIKKLMAYANDGSATDGEIENAMGHAQKLIDRYHLDKADFEKGDEERDDSKMGRFMGKTASSKFHQWETTLASAIEILFGCVKCYLDGQAEPLRINGIAQMYTGKYAGQPKMCRRVAFYGPIVEAQEAAELFTEWCASIATMGVLRWGGAYRGSGEQYCQGFATSLYAKASQVNNTRRLVQAKPLAALPGTVAAIEEKAKGHSTAITLADRYTALQERATEWLEEEIGIKVGKGTDRQGARAGSRDAYREGRAHGEATSFGRQGKAKQLPGGN